MLSHPVVATFKAASTMFQLVLTPFDRSLGEEKQERMMTLARNADGVLVVIAYEPLSYVRELQQWFEDHNIDISSDRLAVEIILTSSGGLRIVGKSGLVSETEIADFVLGYNIRNAIIKLSGKATLEDVENSLHGRMSKRTLYAILHKNRADELAEIATSVFVLDQKSGLDAFGLTILKRLNLIRVFTKGIGDEIVDRPVLVRDGSKVIEVARQIHKDFSRNFRYARILRKSQKDYVRVGQKFRLEDQDVIEIHAS